MPAVVRGGGKTSESLVPVRGTPDAPVPRAAEIGEIVQTMMHGALLLMLAAVTAATAARGGMHWLLLWPAVSMAVAGLGYLGVGAGVFGKQATGTLAWPWAALMFPYLLVTWAVWHAIALFSREDCCNEVIPGVFVGRRPLAGEVPAEVTLMVDLTAEFPECRAVRAGRRYVAFPILDGGTPPDHRCEALVRLIAEWPEPVYIHCAQGHGRAGMVAALLLVAKGVCGSGEEAVERLRGARPGVRLAWNQRALVERICRQWAATAKPVAAPLAAAACGKDC